MAARGGGWRRFREDEDSVSKTDAKVASMTASSTHPEYDKAAPSWSRARDVLAGEDAVKAAGEKYLPKLDSQSDEEYAAYKTRTSFFGATIRTLEEYLDVVLKVFLNRKPSALRRLPRRPAPR